MRRRNRHAGVYHPPTLCDGQHQAYYRCDDPNCYQIPQVCPGDKLHGERCRDPNCTNVRGKNGEIALISSAHWTLQQFRDFVYRHKNLGPPGTERERDIQRKRFNQEANALIRQIVDLARPLVVDFVNRWRTVHLPGQP